MPYQAILFDMDGVIVDTHQAVTTFWQKWSRIHQVQLSQVDFQQNIYGCPATHTLDLLFPALDADERQAMIADMTKYEINQSYTAVKGVLPFLSSLKQQEIPIALATSGEQWKVNAVLTQLNLHGIFDATVTIGDIRYGKPHPDCYVLAAARLQKSPEQCLVFEDAISGVKAAVAAGALCVGIQPWHSAPLLEAGARFVIPDFASIRLQPGRDGADGALNLRVGSEASLPFLVRR